MSDSHLGIDAYIISNPDEFLVLPDALDSLAKFANRIWVVDGGLVGGTLNQHPTITTPLRLTLPAMAQASFRGREDDGTSFLWNEVPLMLLEHEFTNPGAQRNWMLDRMSEWHEQPDWIAWLDSDEIFSNEFCDGVRSYLANLSADATNVTQRWLTLVEDGKHYAPSESNWLSHGRLHHPRTVRWGETWHEHQNYIGRRENWDVRVIHTRLLYRKRLQVQRGHNILQEGAWSGVTAEPVPAGVTYDLHWLEGEPVIPVDKDIRAWTI